MLGTLGLVLLLDTSGQTRGGPIERRGGTRRVSARARERDRRWFTESGTLRVNDVLSARAVCQPGSGARRSSTSTERTGSANEVIEAGVGPRRGLRGPPWHASHGRCGHHTSPDGDLSLGEPAVELSRGPRMRSERLRHGQRLRDGQSMHGRLAVPSAGRLRRNDGCGRAGGDLHGSGRSRAL